MTSWPTDNDLGTTPNDGLSEKQTHFARTRIDSLVAGMRRRFDEHAAKDRIDEREITLTHAVERLWRARDALQNTARALGAASRGLGETAHAKKVRAAKERHLLAAALEFDEAEIAHERAMTERRIK